MSSPSPLGEQIALMDNVPMKGATSTAGGSVIVTYTPAAPDNWDGGFYTIIDSKVPGTDQLKMTYTAYQFRALITEAIRSHRTSRVIHMLPTGNGVITHPAGRGGLIFYRVELEAFLTAVMIDQWAEAVRTPVSCDASGVGGGVLVEFTPAAIDEPEGVFTIRDPKADGIVDIELVFTETEFEALVIDPIKAGRESPVIQPVVMQKLATGHCEITSPRSPGVGLVFYPHEWADFLSEVEHGKYDVAAAA